MEGALLTLSLALLTPKGLHGKLSRLELQLLLLSDRAASSHEEVWSLSHRVFLDWKEVPGGVSVSGFLGYTVLFINFIISKYFSRWRWAIGWGRGGARVHCIDDTSSALHITSTQAGPCRAAPVRAGLFAPAVR